MQSGGGKEWDVFQDDDSEGDDEHSVSGERKKKTATALVKMTVMPITIMIFFSGFTAVFAELHEDSVEF